MDMDLLGRPDDYYETLAAQVPGADHGLARPRGALGARPKAFTWIVVGDAAKVRPQLEKLGMPMEVVEAP